MLISDTLDEDVDLYDFVEDEEDLGDEIYEDLMRTEEHPERVSEALNQMSPSNMVSVRFINVQNYCCSSSRNVAWTNESAACRRSDRRKKNTRRRWSL